MSLKKILVINLNEFNYNYLKYGCKKYSLKYLKKLLSLKKISTFTKDKIQNKDLQVYLFRLETSRQIHGGDKSPLAFR